MSKVTDLMNRIESLPDNFKPDFVIERLREEGTPLSTGECHIVADFIEAVWDRYQEIRFRMDGLEK